MTKKFKRTLFITASLFFLISAPTLIFYSQGYRFDFANKKIVKTGGLFLKISPPGVNVYIDHNLSNKTNFFFDSAFIDGLTPKEYQITIKKDGYYDWTKALSVKEKQVTEAKNILLLPKNPKFKVIGKNIDSFFFSPKANDMFLKIDQGQTWTIKRIDPQNQKQTTVINQKDLEKTISSPSQKKKKSLAKQNSLIFSSLISSPDSKRILLKTILNGQNKYFIVDLEQEIPLVSVFPSIPISASSSSPFINVKNIIFGSRDSKNIFFLADYSATTSSSTIELNNELEKYSLDKKNELKNSLFVQKGVNQTIQLISSPLINQDIITYQILDNNNIIWLSKGGFLYLGKINSNTIDSPEILNLKPLAIDRNANYKIIAKDSNKIFIKENEHLYYLSPEKHIFKRIFDTAKEIVFDNNARKIAVREEKQIWLFYLEASNEQPQRVAEEKMLLSSFAQNIKNLFWLNDSHILFQEDNNINVIETDNRSKPNINQVASFPSSQIFWDKNIKTLFVLSDNNLYACDDILK